MFRFVVKAGRRWQARRILQSSATVQGREAFAESGSERIRQRQLGPRCRKKGDDRRKEGEMGLEAARSSSEARREEVVDSVFGQGHMPVGGNFGGRKPGC